MDAINTRRRQNAVYVGRWCTDPKYRELRRQQKEEQDKKDAEAKVEEDKYKPLLREINIMMLGKDAEILKHYKKITMPRLKEYILSKAGKPYGKKDELMEAALAYAEGRAPPIVTTAAAATSKRSKRSTQAMEDMENAQEHSQQDSDEPDEELDDAVSSEDPEDGFDVDSVMNSSLNISEDDDELAFHRETADKMIDAYDSDGYDSSDSDGNK